LVDQWCIPPEQNAEFVCQMEDILEVYHRPLDPRRPLVCMDELSKQLVAETRASIAASPGHVKRMDHEYERRGTCNVFMFCAPLSGWRHVEVTDRRTKIDWAYAIRELVDVHCADAEVIVLVMDNLNTHTPASLYEAFPPAEARRIFERLEIHYTPKHGSWLNIAECELSVLNRQCLDRYLESKERVTRETAAWENDRNETQTGVDWQFSTDDARIKLKRLYPTIQT
jgi:hypothetical protein